MNLDSARGKIIAAYGKHAKEPFAAIHLHSAANALFVIEMAIANVQYHLDQAQANGADIQEVIDYLTGVNPS